jgi:hypothetical protein
MSFLCTAGISFFIYNDGLVRVKGIWRPEQWIGCRHVAWCSALTCPPLQWSANRDNNVVAGLHPVAPLYVSYQYALSHSLLLQHNVRSSLSAEDFCVAEAIPSSCDVMKSHHRMARGWGRDRYISARRGFTLNLMVVTMTNKMASSIVLLNVDIFSDKNYNYCSFSCSWY